MQSRGAHGRNSRRTGGVMAEFARSARFLFIEATCPDVGRARNNFFPELSLSLGHHLSLRFLSSSLPLSHLSPLLCPVPFGLPPLPPRRLSSAVPFGLVLARRSIRSRSCIAVPSGLAPVSSFHSVPFSPAAPPGLAFLVSRCCLMRRVALSPRSP